MEMNEIDSKPYVASKGFTLERKYAMISYQGIIYYFSEAPYYQTYWLVNNLLLGLCFSLALMGDVMINSTFSVH